MTEDCGVRCRSGRRTQSPVNTTCCHPLSKGGFGAKIFSPKKTKKDKKMNHRRSRGYLQSYGIGKEAVLDILHAIENNQKPAGYTFAELADRYGDPVYRFCRSLAYSREDADDLFQETFLKIFEQPHKINGSDNPRGFLFSTALYIWKSWKRK